MPDRPVFDRSPKNPLLSPQDAPISCKSICNPAAALYGEDVLLLTRIIDQNDHSQLWIARSRNGIDQWKFDPAPLLVPEPDTEQYDSLGCEDPRLTYLRRGEQYAITYVGYSLYGAGVCLALTKDFQTAEKQGMIIPPYDKDAVLLPRRSHASHLILHRPTINGLENIWMMDSDDLIHWGRPVCVMQKGKEGWDSGKIGSGPPPLETPEGWLLIFHGAEDTKDGWVYRVGLALLDLDDPSRVLARTSAPVFSPEEPYERGGTKPGIVFPTGLIQRGDNIMMYYGADDTNISLATTTLAHLLEAVKAG